MVYIKSHTMRKHFTVYPLPSHEEFLARKIKILYQQVDNDYFGEEEKLPIYIMVHHTLYKIIKTLINSQLKSSIKVIIVVVVIT